MKTDKEKFLEKVRIAVANYVASQGCSCCQDVIAHKQHEKKLGILLKVEKYEDKSGYNFRKYQTY